MKSFCKYYLKGIIDMAKPEERKFDQFGNDIGELI